MCMFRRNAHIEKALVCDGRSRMRSLTSKRSKRTLKAQCIKGRKMRREERRPLVALMIAVLVIVLVLKRRITI